MLNIKKSWLDGHIIRICNIRLTEQILNQVNKNKDQ